MYYSVALLTPPYATLTYAKPSWWPQGEGDFFVSGMRVVVPLGKSYRAAVIIDSSQSVEVPEGVIIKPLAWPLECEPLFDAAYMDMIKQLSLRQYRSVGDILGHVLPLGLRSTNVKVRHVYAGKPRVQSVKAVCLLPEVEQGELANSLMQGTGEILLPRQDAGNTEYCILQVDPPWPVRPLAKRQIAILDYLQERGSVSRRQLGHALGDGATTALASLVKNGHVALRVGEDEEENESASLLPPPPLSFSLSRAQDDALKNFADALASGKAESHLLFGVTGSGKTAVYLELAKMCMEQGKTLLLLAPEVALALKLKRDTSHALPHLPVFLYHGYQSPAKREQTFRTLAKRSEPCVVVGTRSSLFLPLPKLGAIILDEEHDTSYKQDEKLHYHAKEVAWFRVAQQNGLLVLGSATPDLKTYYAAKEKNLPIQNLPERVGGGTLPQIKLVNISNQGGSANILSKESEDAIKETLAKGEQAVILLNRRGYAPLMYCLDCSKVARCPHCEIGLTYHKNRERLVCHYCGYNSVFPTVCSNCKSMHYLPMGEGTEKLAEYLNNFALGKVLRLDRDSTRREGKTEEILESFARGEAQILVGTQMLSKGHHFPNVTLALVADGDVGLNLPDYRAAERTFQLLVQSAGRAGRGKKPGTVLIQTRDTNHYCWKYIQDANYEGFYEEELQRRAKRNYPPFVFLALIRLSYERDFADGPKIIQEIGSKIRKIGKDNDVTVLGPAPAPLAILRNQRRFHCLLKGKDWNSIRQVYALITEKIDKNKLRFSLDLDPINMI